MADELMVKTFTGVEVKDAEKGEIEAVVATLGVIDKDGDLIKAGALGGKKHKVIMSEWGHDAAFGRRPVGKGTLAEVDGKLVFNGKVFLSTQGGRETFETLKEMGPDQEWSFGFRTRGYEVPQEAERQKGMRRILTKIDAFEVSPVLEGAGIGTRTVGVKNKDGEQANSVREYYLGLSDEEKSVIADLVAEGLAKAHEKREAEAKAKEEEEARVRAEAEAKAEAERKAAEEVRLAEVRESATKEFERFQRTLKRQGVAA